MAERISGMCLENNKQGMKTNMSIIYIIMYGLHPCAIRKLKLYTFGFLSSVRQAIRKCHLRLRETNIGFNISVMVF